MRAWEIVNEHITPSKPITLRALHKIRQQEQRRIDAEKKRHAFMSIMYADDGQQDMALDRRELEQDRREMALDKREAELGLIQQQMEQSAETRDAIKRMAKHAIESENT